jgi:endonuclease I
MKNTFLLSFFIGLLNVSFGQVIINNLSTGYTQNFDSLANTGTSSTVPTGWLFLETGTNANTTYQADDGTLNSGNTYSYGPASTTERAFGTLLSGSVTPTIGAYFTNRSGATLTSLTITYFGEQWRLGNTGRTDRLDFQYSLDATSLATGTWTDVDQLDFSSPITAGTVGALDGNATANRTQKTFTITGLSIANGSTFYIRWNDFNATGADDGLAVDDFSMTFNGTGLPTCSTPTAQPTNLTFGSPTNTSISGNFTASSPTSDQTLVIISTSNTLSGLPQNGTVYSEGDEVGGGTVISSNSSTSFNATSLSPGTTYYFYLFSFNSSCSGGPVYNTASPLKGQSTTTTPPACVAPSGTPGTLTLTAANTSINGSFADAAGADGYLVIRSTSSTIGFTPTNGTSYTNGQTVGSGNTGTVIKFSSGTTFATTGLTRNTTYYFFVYALSGFNCSGGPLYNTTSTNGSATTTNTSSDEPAGYYSAAAGQNCADLKTTLKTIISTGNQPKTYADLWTQYQVSDIKPREVGPGTSANVIWDIYSDNPAGPDPYNFTPGPVTSGGQQDNGSATSTEGQYYNREHSVPLSWFNGNTSTPGPATDYLHIYPTDKIVNAMRSNFIYGEVATPNYTSANGSKLGSSAIAGFTTDVFEPINEYKGDVARSFLYFVTRYQDNMPGWPGNGSGTQAFDPTTYPSVDIPYLQVMLKWTKLDPVSQKEIDRNNAAYVYQGNRNPYIDHPEFVDMVWNSSCPGLAALPVDIIYFGGKLTGDKVMLEWTAENELNFDRYEIERSTNGTYYIKIGEVKALNSRNYSFNDDANTLRGQRTYYRIKTVDKDGKFKYTDVFSLHIPLNTKFSVFPNPASSFIQLQLNSNVTGNVNIQVTDMTGKVMVQQTTKPNGNLIKVSTARLGNATYLIKLTYNGEQYIQKVIVAK